MKQTFISYKRGDAGNSSFFYVGPVSPSYLPLLKHIIGLDSYNRFPDYMLSEVLIVANAHGWIMREEK